ncbi:hypothetical protein MAPG_05277 [Magnaporthiopsis poae ATCC 64411]|uniref:Uncharacterized protein n=1 Tax=Magnaporthiopsis poae (strain ATCC 64411 / 73-15) TaxID=644358 RepID=A0A0C4DYZ2_MAGP6|nr:hypothetical protein MAPG_05277 [Magnaporthiopsis poae ATCC 64411]
MPSRFARAERVGELSSKLAPRCSQSRRYAARGVGHLGFEGGAGRFRIIAAIAEHPREWGNLIA